MFSISFINVMIRFLSSFQKLVALTHFGSAQGMLAVADPEGLRGFA